MDEDIRKSMVLRYGQVVRIHSCFDDSEKGLLVAKGFIDSNVSYMTFQNFQSINNYRESLFQILPRGTFEIHDEYQKTSSTQREMLEMRIKTEADQYHMIMQNRFNEEIIFGSEVIFKHVDSEQYLQGSYECSDFSTDAFKLKLAPLLSSLTVFKLAPYQTFQQEGHPIYIEEPLIIEHEKSQCKLDFVKDVRVLTLIIKQYNRFLWMRKFPLQQMKKKWSWMKQPTKILDQVQRNLIQNVFVLKQLLIIIAIVVGFLRSMKLTNQQKSIIIENYMILQQKQSLKPYDLVFFHYTENKSFLSVDQNKEKVLLKQMKNLELPLDAVWEVQSLQPQQKQDQYFETIRQRNVSMVDSVQFRTRNSIFHPGYQENVMKTTQKKYILRHFLSGKVITLQCEKSCYQAIINNCDSSQEDQQFELRTAKKGFEDIVQHAYIKIANKLLELQPMNNLRKSINKGNLMRRESSSYSQMEAFFKKLNEEDLDFNKHAIEFTARKSLHAFQLLKLSDDLKKDLSFIISSHELLMQFADILKLPVKQVELYLNDKILAVILDVLKQLLAYVMGLKDKNDIDNSESLPNKKRQRYMKDLLMVEIIMEIIFFMSYKNGSDKLFKQWKNEREKLKSIYKYSYMLIEKMTKNNPQIKLHVSQWLELFIHQAMSIDDITVQASLSELLDDNFKAISTFITKTSLKRLIALMKQRVPHEKYLRILSCICICNGKSIINNQINVLSLFYQQILPEFTFQFKINQDNQIQVLCHLGKKDLKWRTMMEFYEDSESADDLQSWNYFLSYFNLLADLCTNRNKFAKKYVEENFQLPILCALIEEPECERINATEPFLKVIQQYLNIISQFIWLTLIASITLQLEEQQGKSKQYFFNKIRVREWHTIEQKNDILRTHADDRYKPENCDLKRIMNFIEKFLNGFDYFSVKNKVKNHLLYTVLFMLKTTLRLGFWQSIKNLQALLPCLLKICSCNKDFKEYTQITNYNDLQTQYNYNKSRLTKMNLENIMVMKCKILACEIIDIMIDMETNVRVSKATQIFKRMVENVETPSLENSDQGSTQKSSANLNSKNFDFSMTPKNKKQVNTLSTLEEKHLEKRKSNLFYQLFEGKPKAFLEKKQSAEFDIIKNISNVLKQEQLASRDAFIYSIDVWIQELNNLIQSRNLFHHISPYIVEVLFAELSLFENIGMLQFALSLLNRIYGQRRELVRNFEKILIVASGFTQTLSVESRVIRTKLFALADRNILSCTYDNQKDFNVYLWRQSKNAKETGIIQDLKYLVSCLKRGKPKRVLSDNDQGEVYTEREQNHKLHQSLIKCQDLHESILLFIEITKDITVEQNDLLIKLLMSCYNFLTLLIWNHSENKADFIGQLDIIYNHLKFNIGCSEFLRELFTNNKTILQNESQVRFITEKVLNRCNEIKIDNYYKSKLLDLLRVLIVFNNKPIKNNQIHIMSQMQNKHYKNIMISFKKSGQEIQYTDEEFLFWIQQYEENYSKCFESGFLNLSPQLTYFFTFFQLFSLLIEDRNEINAGKSKQMHSFKSLLTLYEQAGNCFPLKRYLRAYMNRLYYTQEEYEGLSQLLMESDFGNIVEDLYTIVEIKQTDIDNIQIEYPIRYTYLQSYFYLLLEENLITLNMIFNRSKFLEDLENVLVTNFANQKFKVHFQLLEMGQLLSQIKRLWSNCKFITQFSKILMTVLRSIYNTFDLTLLILREQLLMPAKAIIEQREIIIRKFEDSKMIEQFVLQRDESSTDPAHILNTSLRKLIEESPNFEVSITEFLKKPENIQYLKDQLINQVFDQLPEIRQSKSNNVSQSLKRIFQKKNNNEDVNEVLNQKHRRLMSAFNLSTKFTLFNEEEFYIVCEKLNRIDEESKRIYGTSFPVITLKEFIQNIIYMNINDPGCLSDELRVFFLKVLARIITEKNTRNQQEMRPIDTWTPEFWSDSKEQIEKAQNFLQDCGAAELICSYLKHTGLEEKLILTNELLIFGVAFLLGGNTQCQNSILRHLKEDSSNLMLINYTNMIKRIGMIVYNNRKIRKAKFQDYSKFSVQLIDNYDYWDGVMMIREHQVEVDDFKETNLQKNCLDIMCRAFRMLQLLCENNNVDMKNFIRVQVDADGTTKLNSINLLEFVTSQLRIFLKIMNVSITNVPNFMMDFLIEVIQLPCLDNQLTLCKTTFFEDACYLSQFFADKQNQLDRNFKTNEDLQNLHELYNKILLSVMSVLEGNDDRIYEDLQTKLEPRFLIEIIKQNLEILQVQNAGDMRKLLEYQDEQYSEEIVKILNVLVIRQKIKFRVGRSKWLEDIKNMLDPQLKQIIKILKKKIRKIEIVYQEKSQIIFYPSHPLFDFLSDQSKDKIMFNIKRDTQREKIIGLLEVKEIIFNEIEHNYKLNQSAIPITHRTIKFLEYVAGSLSILVNISMIDFLNIRIKMQSANFFAEFYEQIIINMLQFCQLFASIFYVCFYIINRLPLCLKKFQYEQKQKQEEQDKNEEEIPIQQEVKQQDHLEPERKISVIQWRRIKQQKQHIIVVFKQIIKRFVNFCQTKLFTEIIKLYNQLQYLIQLFYFLIAQEEDFTQIVSYLLCSIMGTFVKDYFFSLHLIYIFVIISRLALLSNVFSAISYNSKQLMVVAFLGILFVFVFSFTAFDSYVDEIYKEDEPEENCNTLITCMITLITSGVIGTSMSKWDPVKFFYDTVYFVFFALLFTNIVSGIMIDTFAELRDQRQKIEDDKKNMCFICGIDRVTVEKNYEDFEEHIANKHYLWNYIFYIYCLIKKDSTEYTGLEYAISDMIEKENISWFPIRQQDNSLFEKIEMLSKRVEQLELSLDERNLEMANTIKQIIEEKKQNEEEKSNSK